MTSKEHDDLILPVIRDERRYAKGGLESQLQARNYVLGYLRALKNLGYMAEDERMHYLKIFDGELKE